MKKIHLRYILCFLVSIISRSIFACDFGGIHIRNDSQQIRQEILKGCSLGTSFDGVISAIKRRGYIPYYSRSGFLRQSKDERMAVVGVSSIKVELGDYWAFPFITTNVTVFWGFNLQSKLIDVWVWKTADAP